MFLTENSPAMTLVDSKGLFTKLDPTTLDQIPDQYQPDNGNWTGFAGRSTVLVYNTDELTEDELPDLDHGPGRARVGGTISFSPTGADFQAIVSAVLATQGEEATREWLAGLKSQRHRVRRQQRRPRVGQRR